MTSPAMDAALAADVVVDFAAVEVVLPFATIRLVEGAGQVSFTIPDAATDAPVLATFVGEDPTYGTVTGLDGFTEGLGTSAPRLRFVITPPTRAAAAQLNLPTNQGSLVRAWYGCVSPTTGAVVPNPEELFTGMLDQPRSVGGVKRAHAVEYDVASAMELLFASEEGQRVNHAQHIRTFPGELGLQYVSEVERQLPWGADVARSRLVPASDGGYGAGNGNGGGGGGGGIGGGGGGGGIGGGGNMWRDVARLVSRF